MKKFKIHLGNAGTAGLECRAWPTSKWPAGSSKLAEREVSNWTWSTTEATCKKCLTRREKRFAK